MTRILGLCFPTHSAKGTEWMGHPDSAKNRPRVRGFPGLKIDTWGTQRLRGFQLDRPRHNDKNVATMGTHYLLVIYENTLRIML